MRPIEILLSIVNLLTFFVFVIPSAWHIILGALFGTAFSLRDKK